MSIDYSNLSDDEFLESKPISLLPTAKKLTKWKNEPTLEQLKSDFDKARGAHDEQQNKIDHWLDLLMVRGSAKPVPTRGRSSVQPKLIRRQAEWRYSALTEPFLSSHNLFQVQPKTFEDADAAKQNSLVLNWQFDTLINKVKFIDDYVRATVDEGTCIVRVSWLQITKKVKETVPVFDYYPVQDEQVLQILQQAAELQQSNPRAYEEQVSEDIKASVEATMQYGVPTQAVPAGETQVETEKIIENRPEVEVLNPANIYIDPSCNGDFDKALFAICSFETNKASLQATGLYQNLDSVDWSGSPNDSDHTSATPPEFLTLDPSRNKVVAYEYWGYYDVEGNGELKPIVATWVKDTLIRLEENPYPDQKLPFVIVPYLPVKRELYGEPDAELLEDNQRILGAVTRGMIDSLGRSANAQQGFAKGMLDALNRRKFERGDDYEFNPNMHPSQGFVEHKYPELPQSAMMMVQLQNQEAEALTGVKSFSGGLGGNAYGDVAAGVRGMLDAASKREMAILRRLAKGMQQIGVKIIAMNSEFLSDKEVVRVTNRQFIEINREDLKGNFDLEVDINTAEVDNAKAQDMGFMLQTLGPALDPSMTKLIMAEIADLKRMPDLAEQIRSFQPQPDPFEEQMKQIQLQTAQLNLQKIQAEIEFIGSRANKMDQEAEGQAIDNQQEISGEKHQQELERQKAQSQGNQALEVTKAMLRPLKPDESTPNIDGAIGYNLMGDKMAEVADRLKHPLPSMNTNPSILPPGSNEGLESVQVPTDPSQVTSINPSVSLNPLEGATPELPRPLGGY